MARRWLWPTCTVADCRHVHTWLDQESVDTAVAEHSDAWTMGNGRAYCHCHPGAAKTFPCDHPAPGKERITLGASQVPVDIPAAPESPVDTGETATCAACGGAITPAAELDSGWKHQEAKRDYRHPAWPAEQ